MNVHFAIPKWWGIFVCLLFIQHPISSQTVDEFMGVTTRSQDPINRMKAVGTIREYHPWVFNEGFPSTNNASPPYPNNEYAWNPNYINFIRFDDFYNEISAEGLTISPVTLRGIPQVTNPFLNPNDPNAEAFLAQKPIMGGADPLSPASYISHAAYLYHYAARYGKTVFSPNRQNALISPRLAEGEVSITGLGVIDYLENWNEPDQFSIFSPEEFAAMYSADYDGHAQTLGLVPDPDNPSQTISTVGIKNADPTMKVVMGGLENADLDYIRRMVAWFVANRPANAQFGQIPLEVLNIHNYLANDPNFPQATNGVAPEAGGLRALLQPFDDYRDSLNINAELWLSEFGYDTNNNSPISVPTFGAATQYQIQGQWLLRGYLETLAAGFDKAMIFDLRDACTGPFCTLFASAGLLETQFNDFKPKDAWYYTYTMKNVLTDMVFDADISACSDFSCTSVFRFIDPNNSNKKVYAVWSPTAKDTSYTFNLSLEGATAGTLVELGVPSILGITSPLVGGNPSITVSETPVFVVVSDTYSSGVGCTSNLTVSDRTCSTMKLNWDAANGVDKFQIFYQTGLQTAATFDYSTAVLVADEIDGNALTYTLTDLPIEADLTLFLIPEGVAVDPSNPNAASICSIQTSTLAVGNDCTIPLAPSMIFDPFISLENATRLVDEQATLNPFCTPNISPTTNWGFDFPPDMSVTKERLSLDLGAYYFIDALALFDGGGIGLLEVETAETPNGPWTTLLTYPTVSTFEWRYFANLPTNGQPIRYLRLIASEDDMVQIGELFLCGTLSNFNPDIAPGSVRAVNLVTRACNDLSIEILGPFDRDIASYRVQIGANTQIINFTSEQQSVTFTQLDAGVNYPITVTTIDNAGQESTPFTTTISTLSVADCDTNCFPNCPTQLCLKPSWITDLTPQKPTDYNPTRLVDEQNTAPVCGDNTTPSTEWGFEFDPTDNLPPVIAQLDLQAPYWLDSIFLFDGNASGLFIIDYLDENDDWQNLFNYNTVAFNEWALFEFPSINARFLRLTKFNLNGNINEIVIHGRRFVPTTPTSSEISDFAVISVNCTDANLNWTLPINSNIANLTLEQTTTQDLVAVNLPTSTSSFTLTDLRPQTVYECYLFARDNTNTLAPVNILTFQTPDNSTCLGNTPPQSVSSFQTTNIDCESVNLTWIAPTDMDIAYYNLTVQPDNITYAIRPLAAPIDFTVGNLQENTNYQFSIEVVDLDGATSSVQTTSATTLSGPACDGGNGNQGANCLANCPTYICVEPAWVEEFVVSGSLDATNLFDEVDKGNPICGQNGIPRNNWGEDYTPGKGIPPIICTVDLQQSYNLESIYLFDVESQGNFRMEYLNNSGNWVEIATYNTSAFNVWKAFDNLNITTNKLRFSKLDNPAKIAEIALFGTVVSD